MYEYTKNDIRMIVPQPLIVCLFLMPCLATLLQLVGVSSQSWAVWTDHHTSKDVFIGVWYNEVCEIKTGVCTKMSHYDEHLNNMENEEYHKEVQYTMRVMTQFKTTVALIFSLFGSILSILALCNTVQALRFTLGAIVSLFISGCFVLPPVISLASETIVYSKIMKYTVFNYTYHFPWSLVVSGIGGLITIVVGVFMFILLAIKLKLPPSQSDSIISDSYFDLTPNNKPLKRDDIRLPPEETKIPLNDFSSSDDSSS